MRIKITQKKRKRRPEVEQVNKNRKISGTSFQFSQNLLIIKTLLNLSGFFVFLFLFFVFFCFLFFCFLFFVVFFFFFGGVGGGGRGI